MSISLPVSISFDFFTFVRKSFLMIDSKTIISWKWVNQVSNDDKFGHQSDSNRFIKEFTVVFATSSFKSQQNALKTFLYYKFASFSYNFFCEKWTMFAFLLRKSVIIHFSSTLCRWLKIVLYDWSSTMNIWFRVSYFYIARCGCSLS